ncbi:peptidase S8/S53 subtilisin kexin sedolisin [Thalassotalea sp. HSM 43]|uniref:S8 family peptidase n=1 Tax=Thalassotalea sp. HSM 43 TaxID=2552945 RepID=UPI001081E2DF|nr:S8 family serine peptidase [Thalassotalea sp. HSM 43]QBY04046.1 peptidase S8/S53 subtilisin kexin sedolisin [Thalassotalea sp. HSM 43]
MKTKIISIAMLAAVSTPSIAGSYLYSTNKHFDANKVEKQVAAKGGQVVDCLAEIGVCKVSFDTHQQAMDADLGLVPNVSTFVPKMDTSSLPVADMTLTSNEAMDMQQQEDDFFFGLQWGHDAVSAQQAWAAGHRGQGVRVAVLDSGADASHPDLSPNINYSLSRSFIADEDWFDYAGEVGNHGTHVAGTIAAADNGFGTIGVAPEAELVILKVLSAYTGSGDSYGTMAAMVYAAQNDVDVINMSLGLSIRKNGYYDVEGTPEDISDDIRFAPGGKDGIAQFKNAYGKAAKYARNNGVILIAAAGNDGVDYDHADSLIALPAELPAVLSISATGPMMWAMDSYTNLDHKAIYTNYGQSLVDFSAPGGDYSSAFMPGGFDDCTVGFITRPCYVFDFVFSTGGNGSWYWSVGTSMASPHAAGVAALIISANGGDMSPNDVEKEMRRLADDLGKPGNDDVHGAGRVVSPH